MYVDPGPARRGQSVTDDVRWLRRLRWVAVALPVLSIIALRLTRPLLVDALGSRNADHLVAVLSIGGASAGCTPMPENAVTERAGESAPAVEAQARGGRARNILVLLTTAALVALGAWSMDRGEGTDASGVTVSAAADGPLPRVGRQAPAFTATTTEGERVDLGDYRGTPVWLSFVATWCSSCRAEAPDMQEVHERVGRDVVMLSVYLSEDEAAVRAYTERLGMTFTHLPDPSTQIAAQYRVLAVPSHFFIDADGVLRSTHVGALSRSRMDAAIQEVTRR